MNQQADLRDQCFMRDNYRCQAAWIAPFVRCSAGLEADHIRNRSTHPHLKEQLANLQTLCAICHRVKTAEPWASTILGLYGAERKSRYEPIDEDTLEEAINIFTEAKRRL